MSAPRGRTTARNFAFQSTDQELDQSLGDPATSNLNSIERNEAAHRPNASEANTYTATSSTAKQIPAQETTLRFPEPLPSQSANIYTNYGFSPGGPLMWDWNNPIEFPEFSQHYEPQGELVQELQNQNQDIQDFSIPPSIPAQQQRPQLYRSPQPVQSSHSATAQNPFSPPPPPPPPPKAPQRPAIQTGMKRKAESEPTSTTSPANPQATTKRTTKSPSLSSASATSPIVAAIDSAPQSSTNASNEAQKKKEPDRSKGTGPQGRVIDVTKPPRRVAESLGTDVLPAGKVFPIQIGSELFRLSGASISSDAPSYFSHFFGEQLHSNLGRAGDLRTLYIDRDPVTFRDISLHLQGYHVQPRDGEHYVRLFADAQFYSLPRLIKQLFNMDIFIRIGGMPFQIPRDLFSSPGDSPNYFSLGFAHFFSTPQEVFPGLDRSALLRPPSIHPPTVPNRSGEIFAQLIKMLQGYEIKIRDEAHRAELLRDARYFHLKGLEQRLIPCEISYNLQRGTSEILIRLEDIRQSGVSFTPDPPSSSAETSPAAEASAEAERPQPGTVCYSRPYTDDHASTSHLILETSTSESTRLHFPASSAKPFDLRASFHTSMLSRITSLFSVVASKMGLPATQPLGLMMLSGNGGIAGQPLSLANSGLSEERVRVGWGSDAWVSLDGEVVELVPDSPGRVGVRVARRNSGGRETEDVEMQEGDEREWVWGGPGREELDWVVKRAHWRLRVESFGDGEGGSKMQIVMCIVRLEAFSSERARNGTRGFLLG